MLDWITEDLRYAARALRRAPAFTASVVVTLALGLGANAAIFSVVDAVLLKTLPVAKPRELYFLAHGTGEIPSSSSTYPLFSRYRSITDAFSGVTAYNVQEFKVATGAGLEPVAGQFVAANYHRVLGIPFILGSGFPYAGTGESLLCVISERYWLHAYARDPSVIGKTLRIQGRMVTIAGVTAAGFRGLRPGTHLDITLPLAFRELDDPGFSARHDTWTGLNIVARLRTGVSEAQALARVDNVFRNYLDGPQQAWLKREGRAADAFRGARLVPAGRGTGGLRTQYDRALRIVFAMVGLVFIVACANVAHLLLVRSSGRAKEIAIRVSLGATRVRLVRQFMTESALLAVGGGILGLLVAVWSATAIVSIFRVGQFPITLEVALDRRLLAFTAALSLLTAVGVGLLPAFHAGSAKMHKH